MSLMKFMYTFLSSILLINVVTLVSSPANLPEVNGNKFYYFGYGSNLLTARIHIQNPSAVKIGMGQLMGWKLDFVGFSNLWYGAPATIVPVENATLYGTLWEIDTSNLPDIDDQEGVNKGLYYAASFLILWDNKLEIIARIYITVELPKPTLGTFQDKDVPFNRQPSKTYLQCLVKGAIEAGLPTWYIDELKAVKHNGRVSLHMEELLQLQGVQLSD